MMSRKPTPSPERDGIPLFDLEIISKHLYKRHELTFLTSNRLRGAPYSKVSVRRYSNTPLGSVNTPVSS